MTPRWCVSRALKALEGDAAWQEKIMELMAACDASIPEPVRELDKPFLMPIEDVFTITGRGTVVTGKVEQGMVHTGDDIEIVGLRTTQKTVCTGVEMFRKLLDRGSGGRQHRCVVAWHEEGRCGAWSGVVQAGQHHAAHELRGSGVCADEVRGWASQAVLQQLSSAVLLPDDRCDRHDPVARGHRDGDAR